MKKMTKVRPKKLPMEFDLSYAKALTGQERRAATFYEYARHSDPIIDLVRELREEGVFSGGGKAASPDLLSRLSSKFTSGVFKADELVMLAECSGFPERPFRITGKYNNLFASGTQSFGIKAPCFIPWPAIDALRADWRKNGLNEVEMLKKFGLYAVSLPFENYTIEEITAMLGERLVSMRPELLPQPKRHGRKGSSKSLGTVDMINQLVVFRLDALGGDFLTKGHIYESPDGFSRAVRAAKRRIDGMLDERFF